MIAPSIGKQQKTGHLRTRCEPQLKTRLQHVAAIQQIDLSDVVRIACVRYVEEFSKPRSHNGIN